MTSAAKTIGHVAVVEHVQDAGADGRPVRRELGRGEPYVEV